MPVQYFAFGLGIQANRPIPGLTPAGSPLPPDVRVWLNETPDWGTGMLAEATEQSPYYISPTLEATGRPSLRAFRVGGGAYYHLAYADGTGFVVDRAGTRVWATWVDPLTVEDTATYLLGPVMALVLRLRGFVCLHASAVELNGQAVALFGPAGAGKSTTAAALAQQGAPVLSDDVTVLVEDGGRFWVQPAYPQLRLWPSSVQPLFGREDALPPLTPNWDKRALNLQEEGLPFQPDPRPLAAIFVLGERQDDPQAPWLDPFPAAGRLATLVANTYLNYLLDREMRAQEFAVLGRLLGTVPLFRLIPHQSPDRLGRMGEVIRGRVKDIGGRR